MGIKTVLTTVICILVFSVAPANAQQKGQYIPGQQGLNAGVLLDPGFTYANLTINYSADTLKNGNGNLVPLTGSYDIWAIENVFFMFRSSNFWAPSLRSWSLHRHWRMAR